MEIYKRYRPKELNAVIGQDQAVSVLKKFIEAKEIPHTILLSGPSGTGKTTLARIIARKAGCDESDLKEINAASSRGIDTIRDIESHRSLAPMNGRARGWIIDEAHQLVSIAQNAFLKLLEDTPRHVYFFLATTDPNKLLKTIQTRCTHIQLRLLKEKEVKAVIDRVVKNEKMKLSSEVIDKIAESAEGSARKALVILEQIYRLDEEDQLAAIEKATPARQAIEIARLLLSPSTKWDKLAEVLKDVEDEPESIRRIVLGYMANVLLGSNKKMHARARLVIEYFSDNFLDTNKAGLVASCYGIIHDK